ncbi:hypothetical protein GCM10010403_24960 [Glycomyces rutgersensis]|uniref:Secreted protein n=1 Tax=Glycomyces rutgersensis TaxID=58115 RepID=A0ABN3FKB1_9ACTN
MQVWACAGLAAKSVAAVAAATASADRVAMIGRMRRRMPCMLPSFGMRCGASVRVDGSRVRAAIAMRGTMERCLRH